MQAIFLPFGKFVPPKPRRIPPKRTFREFPRALDIFPHNGYNRNTVCGMLYAPLRG